MNKSADTATVISLGGSVMTTGSGIDTDFLQVFKKVITERITQRTFYIITGGGSTARIYQQALDEISNPSDERLDWMGIHATRLNGQLLRLVFSDVANDELVLKPEAAKAADAPVVVGAAGATPGRSSDYGPLAIAEAVGADHVIELSDVSHIYSADPDSDPDATPFDTLGWTQYRDMIPDNWQPGLHVPFDPVSAEYAQSHDIEVAIMSGESMQNFTSYLDNGDFVGTTIANTYD
jgi:uridylate kinase